MPEERSSGQLDRRVLLSIPGWAVLLRIGPMIGQYVAVMAFATLPRGFLAAADIVHH